MRASSGMWSGGERQGKIKSNLNHSQIGVVFRPGSAAAIAKAPPGSMKSRASALNPAFQIQPELDNASAQMTSQPKQFLQGPYGRLAYRRREGADAAKPGVLWLGGFRSDMLGAKAAYLDNWAAQQKRAFLRFDYSGHGESEGVFEEGCIGEWTKDAIAVFDALTEGQQILVGSSMGGWIATLLALARPERIAGLVFIAPAPDFTEKLMWPSFTDAQRQAILQDGRLEQPSDYADEPEVITRKLIEDGRRHLVMSGPIPIAVPVRILQGMKDDAVPYAHALDFAKMLESSDVEATLTPNGDHRLSTPADLERLARILESL